MPKDFKTRLHTLIAKSSDLRGNYTKTEIARNIEKYGVSLGGIISNNRLEWVLLGTVVKLNNWPAREITDLSGIKIIFENLSMYALFKPSGILTHPGAGHPNGTLLNWVLENLQGQQELMDSASEKDNARHSAGLLHRLDKDTAGLILVAKSLKEHTRLQDLFRTREVTKKYLAILSGELESEIRVTGWQSRDKRNPMRQRFFVSKLDGIIYDEKSRYSESVFVPLKYDSKSNQTFVEIQIITGRMHQIRVHAKHLNLPVINDPIYNSSNAPTLNFLQEFIDPSLMQLLSNSIGIDSEFIQLIDPSKLL